MLLDESSSFRSVLWGTFPENDPYFTSFGDGSPAKCFWCWRGEYPSEMVLFQHDGMTCCGFDAQKKLNNKKNSTLSGSFECGNLARFEFLGVYKCASCHVFFLYLLFLPGKNLLGIFLGPTQWFQRRDSSERWEISLSTPSGRMKSKGGELGSTLAHRWQKVNHPRLILGKCLGDSNKPCHMWSWDVFFFNDA